MNIYPILFMAQSFVCVFACVFCYTLGAKHGHVTVNGGVPHVKNPVKAVKEAVEASAQEIKEKEAQKKMETELADFMGASRESMMKELSRNRSGVARGPNK